MDSLYNKTALKKMKKDELVEAYLKLQGLHLEELQICFDEEIKKIKSENKKLKDEIQLYCGDMTLFESNESLVKAQKLYEQAFSIQAERDGLREENKKLKVEVEEQASLVEKLDCRIRDARDENKKLLQQKEVAIEVAALRGVEIKKLRKECDVLETAFKVVKEENEINKKNILTYGLGKSE